MGIVVIFLAHTNLRGKNEIERHPIEVRSGPLLEKGVRGISGGGEQHRTINPENANGRTRIRVTQVQLMLGRDTRTQ